MQKYEKMIALNREISDQKIKLAKETIWRMLDEGDKITIPKLMVKTGLSRGFFYKNPAVRQELDRAQEQQAGMPDPRRGILELAMDNEMSLMQEQLLSLQRENAALQKEIERLQKGLDHRHRSAFAKL